MSVTEGQIAPDFTLPATDGSTVRLLDLRGKKVVLYFYPKDDTPGCTKEACAFRDNLGVLQSMGVVVLGVSPIAWLRTRSLRRSMGCRFRCWRMRERRLLPLMASGRKRNSMDVRIWASNAPPS